MCPRPQELWLVRWDSDKKTTTSARERPSDVGRQREREKERENELR